jgi:hypothetical protein
MGVPWQPRSFDDPAIFSEELVSWLRGPGRKSDPNLSYQVEQVWMFYVQWAMEGQAQQSAMMGQAGQPGADTGSADGSTSGNPGAPGAQGAQQADVGQEAAATVQGADQYGEDMAAGAASE